MGRPTAELKLAGQEQETLEGWARRPKSAQALALRSRMILLCATGKTNTEVAAELRITKQTVGKWRQRFIDKRLDGLFVEPRPGTPRKLSDQEVERVLARTLETLPAGRNALVDTIAGASLRTEPQQRASHLAGLCATAPSDGNIQAVERPAVHRQGS